MSKNISFSTAYNNNSYIDQLDTTICKTIYNTKKNILQNIDKKGYDIMLESSKQFIRAGNNCNSFTLRAIGGIIGLTTLAIIKNSKAKKNNYDQITNITNNTGDLNTKNY
ncbi:MAG: hypothetical protein KAJ54_01875 [Candidatus Aenigmarchaeota archaeon]|nr:hypothetical protein [Candidatus Aenigmarchaeota archaeon]